MKKAKVNPSVKRMKELELPKTKLTIDHFSIFHYGHHYSISIGKNYSNPTTAREDINKICMALFGKVRYTPQMLKQLEKNTLL